MNEDSKEQFLGACLVGPGTQRRSELALVLGESSFDMDPMAIDPIGEPALQLATITGLRPFPRAALVDGDDQGADSHSPTELVVIFAVVGHVGENAIPIDSKRTIQNSRSEFGSVVAGAPTHVGRQPQVAAGVAQDGQLGEGGSQEGLGVGPLVPIVNADVPGFVACGVDRSFGPSLDQAAAVGSIADRIEESIESPFFKRRL